MYMSLFGSLRATTSIKADMDKFILLLYVVLVYCLVFSASQRTHFHESGHKGPHSYRFGFDTGPGSHNRHFRYEERDEHGFVRGKYGHYDKYGKPHVVEYIAHPKDGYSNKHKKKKSSMENNRGFCRSLGDCLNKLEVELFRLITSKETQQLKEFLLLHKHIIDFSKKGNRGYTALEAAVLTKNKAILAALLATRKCEPIDNALGLATQLKYHDGVNVFLKYMNSKKRVLYRTLTAPAIDLSDIKTSPSPVIEAPQDIALVLTEEDEEDDETFAEELESDSQRIESSADEKLPTIIAEGKSNGQPKVFLRSNTMPSEKFNAYNLRPTTTKDDKEKPLLERVQSMCGPAPLKNNVDILRKAAISEDHKMIEMLVQSGFYLQDPFEKATPSTESLDSLSESVDRLETYRALCSASYIAIADKDPIKVAFTRSEQLVNLSNEYPENKDELLDLANKSSQFSVELLSLCQSSDEVRQLMQMKISHGSAFAEHKFGRLLVAVNCKQKEFVTHPNCQHIVASLWLEGIFRQWTRWGTLRKCLHVFLQAILMPFMCMITLINPKLPLAKSANVPLNRFLYDATSFFIFLSLILLLLLIPANDDSFDNLSWDYIIHWISFIFVIAAWVKLLANDLPFKGKQFLRCFWSIYDVVMYSIFTVAFICILFLQDYQKVCKPLGNGFLAIAFILSACRTLQWFQLHPSLGPFIIAFARIICSLVKIIIVFLILYCAFTVSLFSLYRHVPDIEDGDKGKFRTFTGAIGALYWALYGQGDADFVEMPNTTNSNDTNSSGMDLENNDEITESFGLILWGLFHLGCVIVLLNMVIALMTIKYEQVTEHCDVEWKFARTKFWMYYFEDCNRVPIPFNIFLFIRTFILGICKKRSKTNHQQSNLPSKRWRQFDPKPVTSETDSKHFAISIELTTSGPETHDYAILMNCLIQRYFQKADVFAK
uniref:Transient receptor ion channel domain-containing protein n=1 Tax=Strigamia maritima TaxID=126957 RepID=T1IVH4_STRMM